MDRILALVLTLVLIPVAVSGEYNKTISIGDPAPSWSDLPGTDGKKHALADLKDKDIVVVVFTCNSCPIAVDYEDRIIAFTKKHAGRVAVVAINVNTIPEDRLPRMVDRAKEKEFNFVYLYDESQRIARAFGADKTPEFFVLNKARKIAYMGAMDDKSPPADATNFFLDAAVTAVLDGKSPAMSETAARGCRIRYAKKR